MAGEVKTYTDRFLDTLYDETFIKAWAKLFLGSAQTCAGCQGPCDGSTLDCTLDSYYANPANGPRPSAGTAQNPAWPGYTWPGYLQYPSTRYDDAPAPTERLPVPAPLRCECGTGVHERSGCHSHWCPCWVSV